MNAPVTKAQWAAERAAAMDAIPEQVQEAGLPAVLLPYQAKVVGLLDTASWPALHTAVLVERVREVGPSITAQRHYYISSLGADAARLLEVIRRDPELAAVTAAAEGWLVRGDARCTA